MMCGHFQNQIIKLVQRYFCYAGTEIIAKPFGVRIFDESYMYGKRRQRNKVQLYGVTLWPKLLCKIYPLSCNWQESSEF